jgi:16S rRNA processing protein RimM
VNKTDEWVVIGRFGRPHGVKGFITVQSFTESRDDLLSYTNWHIADGDGWQPLNVLQTQVNQKSILAQIAGFNTPEQVAAFTNKEIAVLRQQLHDLPPDEYYWHQLIGLHVIDKQGIELGLVTEILPTGSNDVLIVNGETRHLIPYLPQQVVIDVNLKQGQITVDWDADF